MAVNANFWKRFPVAARETTFNADTAIKNLTNVSAGSVERFNMGFLWRNSQGPPNNKNSYRLPIVDVVNGRMTLIPHAVFTAAAILSGAHGGLEGVVGDAEKEQLRTVVSAIYDSLRKAYGDPRVVPPWERNDKPPAERPNRQISAASLPFASADTPWDADQAKRRLSDWAGGNMRMYRKGFLWGDDTAPEFKRSYKLPVCDIVDGELVVVPRAVTVAAGVLAVSPAGVDIPDSDVGLVAGLVEQLQARMDGSEVAVVPPVDLLRPPSAWFDDPQLKGPTRLQVGEDGRVSGHLAQWDTCHMGIRDACRMAPRSHTGYQFFMDGTALMADGSQRAVGKLTVGTGHADINLGYIPAADHYDHTGTAAAIVAAGEDEFGIWVAGALTADATPVQIAALRRSPLSGDWRPTRFGLELVAALAVNSPGFPIMGFTASGDQTLLAAGMVLTDDELSGLVPADDVPIVPDPALVERLNALQVKAVELARRARSRRLNSVLSKLGGGS